RPDTGFDGFAGSARHRHHHDHRGNADDHAEHGEKAAERVNSERVDGDLEGDERVHDASSTILPSRKVIRLCARLAISSSWVTRITVMPVSFSASNSSMISSVV